MTRKIITLSLWSAALVGCILAAAFVARKQNKIPQRYFLISYSCAKENQKMRGSMWLAMKSFPSRELIKIQALSGDKMAGYRPENVVIENIFEFKSKEDYDAFLYTKYNFEKDFDEIIRDIDSILQPSKK